MTGIVVGIGGKQEASAASKGTVTTDGLRVRKGAGTNKAVLTYNGENVLLYKGTSVTIKSEKKVDDVTWYKVSFSYEGKTLTGYISGDYVKVKEDSGQGSTSTSSSTSGKKVTISKNLSIPAKVIASDVNVRKGASTANSKLKVNGKNVTLKKGASVKIIKEVINGDQKWYYVSFTYNKVMKKGYVLSDYVKLVLTRDIIANVYGVSKIKLRTAAGTDKSYKKVNGKTLTVEEGAEVLIIQEKKDAKGGKWFKLSCVYNGTLTKGFIPANHIVLNKVVPIQGRATTNNLRVRSGAGTKYDPIKKDGKNILLKAKQMVTVTAQTKVDDVTWYKVSFKYNDETIIGYVSGEYMELVEYTLNTGTSNKGDNPDEGNNSNKGDNPNEGNNSNKGDNPNGGNNSNKGDNPNEGNNSNKGDNPNGGNNSNKGDNPDEGNNSNKGDNPDEGNNSNKGDNPDEGNTGTNTPAEVITDIETYMTEQGFPESYKAGIRTLYKAHPNWVFKAYHTGLSWDEAILQESKAGLNLISNNKANGWKSYETGAYNYSNDRFIVFDGSTWVTASKEAIAYYMDPRNFMTERGIFQFLTLEYQSEYEIQRGVENILANTPLYKKECTYIDQTTSKQVTKLYSQIFMEAAKKSGVSPYHLATRVKQEVVSNSTTLSGSATGTFSGYEGYYNFYNIGATHSTAAGGAIANGLDFAMGNKSTVAAKEAYMLPWNNPYKAIVGGAAYIGSQYINRGQNTIYLQKFNVTPTSTYSHQYMANVEAANSEAIKLYNGYSSVLDSNLVFYIPVYNNMPEQNAAVPGTVLSPNNWLKTLNIGNYVLTPEFDAESGSSQPYVLNLETEDVETIDITAIAANSNASIVIKVTANGTTNVISNTGTATLDFVSGENIIEIVVTAENGAVNTYTISIAK